MKKYDYMVTNYVTTTEVICDTLQEARDEAKEQSIEHGESRIQKWVFDGSDMVIDEKFSIYYKKGKEVKV